MKHHKYNPFLDNLIITLLVIAVIALIVIAIWFNLLDYLGTIGTLALSLATSVGLAGMVGIDDWLIWYKRWIIKKFSYTEGVFIFKIYDNFLKKHWVECPIQVKDVLYDQEQNPYFRVFVNKLPLYMTFNPFTGNPTLCNHEGYKYGSKLFFISKLEKDIFPPDESLRSLAHDYLQIDHTSSKDVSFNPDSFYYKNRKKIKENN